MGKYEIRELSKKTPSKIFDIGGDKFLLVKLEESKLGIPEFDGKKIEK